MSKAADSIHWHFFGFLWPFGHCVFYFVRSFLLGPGSSLEKATATNDVAVLVMPTNSGSSHLLTSEEMLKPWHSDNIWTSVSWLACLLHAFLTAWLLPTRDCVSASCVHCPGTYNSSHSWLLSGAVLVWASPPPPPGFDSLVSILF